MSATFRYPPHVPENLHLKGLENVTVLRKWTDPKTADTLYEVDAVLPVIQGMSIVGCWVENSDGLGVFYAPSESITVDGAVTEPRSPS